MTFAAFMWPDIEYSGECSHILAIHRTLAEPSGKSDFLSA